MKSLSFFCILSLMLLGCSDTVSGHSARDNGPFQAYERSVSFDLEACAENWEKTLPNVASCTVDIDKIPETFVWNSNRIIHHWEYNDQDWLVDISIYHSEKGYRISMYGSLSNRDEYFKFDVAQKYIRSAIEDMDKQVTQVVIRPKEIGSLPGEMSLGSAVLARRTLDIRNAAFLNKCSKSWSEGKCVVDVLNGTYREALLNAQVYNLKWGSLFLKTKGFRAWGQASGLSDYKVYIGSMDSKLKFKDFKHKWLASVPFLEVNFDIQKFSKSSTKNFLRDRFAGYAILESYSLIPDEEACKKTFKLESEYKSSCILKLPNGTVALANRELINVQIADKNDFATLWARVIDKDIVIDNYGSNKIAKDFESFWNILLSNIERNQSKPILLMRVSHQ